MRTIGIIEDAATPETPETPKAPETPETPKDSGKGKGGKSKGAEKPKDGAGEK